MDMYYTKEELEYKSDTPCTQPAHESAENSFLIPQTISESQKKTLPQQMQNILSKGTISLSLFSCLNPHYGQGIAAHEMGHLLSWMFAQKKLSDPSYGSYKKLRECATKKYKRLKTPSIQPFAHKDDQKYTEEDTADLIAYMAYPNSKTYFCSILFNTEDSVKDRENDREDGIQYADLSIFNNDSDDPHSSSFLRVLSGAIYKKAELSPACEQIIEQYKKDIDFTPCF